MQVKSGPSYLKGRAKDGKQVTVQPYYSEESLASHMNDYAKTVQPVIIVWVNTRKTKPDGSIYEDLLHPEVWWERLDNYNYTGGTVLTLTHKLGEHSKGEWFDTVKPMLKSWSNHPLIVLNTDDRKLFYSSNLKADAKEYYQNWKQKEDKVEIGKLGELTVKKTRIGWRHINLYKRGLERINNSLRLLSIAEKIMQSQELCPVKLGVKEMLHGGYWIKVGLRARVKVAHDSELKVQVVLLLDARRVENTKECHFFSVHIIK